MRRDNACLLITAVSLLTCFSADAATNYVWSGGANASPYTSWATASHSIQSAVNASATGGTVMVAAGTYNLPVMLNVDNGVQVESQSGAAATILVGNGASRCAYINEGAVMKGFTFTGGRSAFGGGVLVDGYSAVLDSIIDGNTAPFGGGVYAYENGMVVNCTLSHNYANRGGGAYLNGGAIMNSTLKWNVATNAGGGVYMVGGPSGGPSFLFRSGLSYNISRADGGGVFAAKALILKSTIDDNSAWTNGGGIRAEGDLSTQESKIRNNFAGRDGGGVFMTNGTCVIVYSFIDNNRARNGGGIYMDKRGYVNGSVLTRNNAGSWGGGIYSLNAGRVEACTIVSNVVAAGVGGGLYSWSGTMTSIYTICYFNKAGGTTSNRAGAITWSYSCSAPTPAGTANTGSDPQFMDKANLDLRLRGSSPCVDWRTTAGTARDVMLVPRPLDGDNNGVAAYDIGAYERVNRRADTDGDGYRDQLETSRHSDATLDFVTPYAFNDYDDDGISDLAVHEEKTGAWFVRSLVPGAPPPAFAEIVGGEGRVAVPGIYGSFNSFDLTSYKAASGSWISRTVEDPPYEDEFSWGGAGMEAVPGDYDGDKYYDPAVYEVATGNWFIRRISSSPPICFGLNWGGAGMDPVPGDYDGDGIFDLAVYQTASGNWFIRSLVSSIPICFGQNWGGPGLTPVPGDFNADGLWDLALYQDSTGYWFIRSLGPVSAGNPPICFGQQWGGAGMIPVPGDFNGDGMDDLAVYQTSSGNWFIRALGPVGPGNPPIVFGMNWGGMSMKPVGSP